MNCKEYAKKTIDNIEKVIKGKHEEITVMIAAMLAGGNILLEDVPGTGKTVLARAAAKSISCGFKRIQLTPDLLPSDITGIHFFNMKEQLFELRKGPVFTNILLADEINRATPRTQSALLECMEEKQVTIDGEEMKLALPFIVIATQNPVENAGTFPLPEAQLDRFLIKMSLGYAVREQEGKILSEIGYDHPIDSLEPVVSGEDLPLMQQEAVRVRVNEAVRDYILDIGEATRNHPSVVLGASTRGLLALKRMSQALAAIKGQEFVTPDNVQDSVRFVLPHRLICRGAKSGDIIDEIVSKVKTPTE
ncbi:MAG TPA: magnesium chelatase [Ruminococcaceae bacterium]|nr:magnesium chelatase [Oscillospiraceae bacterium]